MKPLAEAVQRSDVLVCVGPGGVGKTTVAATLALRSAVEGKGALVCTIDPAKRLANSLGLTALGNTETRIPDDALVTVGQTFKAPMHAMMLDMKRAWDDLVERRAPPDKRELILKNKFYQALSSALAGSQEYIAIEKLCELHRSGKYPLVVLDTPPTAHALDFLDAPNRILDFLDNDAAKWLLSPALAAGKVGLKLFNLGGSYITKTISRIIGVETLQELAGFMLNVQSMYEGFRERAHQTQEMLRAPTTSFVLVTGPSLERLDELVQLHTLLVQNHMRVAAVVVNRVHAPISPDAWSQATRLAPPLKQKVEQTLTEDEHLAEQDRTAIAKLGSLLGSTPVVVVPRFDLDVHDPKALWGASNHLFGEALNPKA